MMKCDDHTLSLISFCINNAITEFVFDNINLLDLVQYDDIYNFANANILDLVSATCPVTV